MSAWMVSVEHIDFLVSAGLVLIPYSYQPLTWIDAKPDESCFREGEPWGPGMLAFMHEHRQELTRKTAGRVGAMLLAENARSVNHRYAEDEIEEPYEYKEVAERSLDPVWVLKAIDCYEYQACEHPGWIDSEAHAFVTALRGAVIDQLPGYDDAPWGIGPNHITYAGRRPIS